MFGSTRPFRPERCAGVGADGGLWCQPLRTALHTIIISPKNSFCESHTWRLVSSKALGELNAYWELPLYTVSEDEKSKKSYQKSVKRKN